MRLFIRWIQVCLITVFLVIAAGGIVRMTSAGMGCPDWPKCFGQIIPPTHISQLPLDYKEIYKVQGKIIADFSPFKTWVEYINRLIGAVLGLFLIILTGISLSLWKKDKRLFFISFFILILTAFQAWLGALVVASNLAPARITIHMIVALLIAGLIILLRTRAKKVARLRQPSFTMTHFRTLIGIALLLTLVQVTLGTQVREQIDRIALETNERKTWIQELSTLFYVHRSFSIVVLGLNAFIIFQINRQISIFDHKPSQLVILAIFISIFSGTLLNYVGFPAFAQPIHLLAAALLFTAQFAMFLQAKVIQSS